MNNRETSEISAMTSAVAESFAALMGYSFLRLDSQGQILDVSGKASEDLCTELQLECKSLQGLPWSSLLDDSNQFPWAAWAEKALNEKKIQEFSVRLRRSNGTTVRYHCKLHFSEPDQQYYLAIRPISAHEESLPATLQSTLNRLNLALKTANMGIWEIENFHDGSNRLKIHWDAKMSQMHGVPEGTAVDTVAWFYKHVHPEDLQGMVDGNRAYQADPERGILELKYRMIWPNGEVHFIETYGSNTPFEGNEQVTRLYGVGKDVTARELERKFLDDQKNRILANSRMTILGEISGGLAHEINNPLTVIQARSFQLLQMLEHGDLDPAKVRAAAESISKTGDKIAKIVKSIRAFGQSQENTPFDLVSIEELIQETLDFCKVRFYNHGIDIRIGSIPEDLEVECRLIQIEEVLLNLFNNAHDAIMPLPEKWILVEAHDKDDSVEIHVTDSGPGISEGIAGQIMLPFFTTKDSGKGTGLGLSIAAEIVQSHGGSISIDRTCPHTRFVLRLPKIHEAT